MTFNFVLRGLVLIFCVAFISGCVSSSKYNDLEKNHQDLKLIAQNLEAKLGKATVSIDQMQVALDQMRAREARVATRMQEYKKLVDKFKSLIDTGQLNVRVVGGRMVIALPSDVLFSSGSARLSENGVKTIKEISPLLMSFDKKEFQIEGHTDNVPISTAQYPSNWDLAAARALTVLNFMLEAGMPEDRVSAATFGETRPVLENETEEGRKANRRIEIVVVPDLSQLPGYEELETYSKEQAESIAPSAPVAPKIIKPVVKEKASSEPSANQNKKEEKEEKEEKKD